MGLPDFLNHVLNFFAPAFWVALSVTLFSPIFMRKQALAGGLIRSAAINFGISSLILIVGLLFFGRDGKMSTYAAMALFCASSQWVLQRGWRI